MAESEIMCPSTGEVCPALKNLRELYVGNEDVVDHDTATSDRIKFGFKRSEYIAASAIRGCEGVVDGICSTRKAMDASPVRVSLVDSLRRLVRHSA
ncbi:MAG: hypothetical protein WAO28_00580 [Candidatus Microsaccharimonas sp.]